MINFFHAGPYKEEAVKVDEQRDSALLGAPQQLLERPRTPVLKWQRLALKPRANHGAGGLALKGITHTVP